MALLHITLIRQALKNCSTMDNKIVKARHGKAPIKLPPVAGKTPRAEHIQNSKTMAKGRTKSGKSHKGKKTLAAKQNEQQQQSSEQQQPPNDQRQQQCEQQQQRKQLHQPAYDSDLFEDEKAELQSLFEIKKRVQIERPYAV